MVAGKESVYWMESEVERKRLASNHNIAKEAMGGRLILAPIDFSQPRRILDSATADGTWLLDLSASVPDSHLHIFVGTDINPKPFPAPSAAPPNITFFPQDINKEWPEDLTCSFDLVHQRLGLLGAGRNPQAAVHGLGSLVKPGGWIQLIEATMEFPAEIVDPGATPAFCDLLKLMKGVADVVGGAWMMGRTLRGLVEAEGFVDVQEQEIVLRMGRTHPDAELARNGAVSCAMAVQGLGAFAKTFPEEKRPLTEERMETLQADLMKELTEKGAVFPLMAVWARKPE